MKKKLLFLFFLSSFSAFAQKKPELFIFSVGIKNYQNEEYNLKYADKDAIDIADMWEKQTDLYDVRKKIVLINEEATRANIRSKFDYFKERVTANDLFIFIFSGHGKEEYLVPYDFDTNDPYASSFGMQDFTEKLKSLGCNYVILLDACHSGSFAKINQGKDITSTRSFQNDVEEGNRRLREALNSSDKNTIIITSSSSDQKSFECEDCKHGYFAQSILDCFNGVEVTDPNDGKKYIPTTHDKSGSVSVSELENYLQETVRIKSAKLRYPQKVHVLSATGGVFPVLKMTTRENSSLAEYDSNAGNTQDDKDNLPDDKDSKTRDEYAPAKVQKLTPTSQFNESTNGITFTMQNIEASTFTMGDRTGAKAGKEEAPPHKVKLDRNFSLGKTEVTNEQFCQFLNKVRKETPEIDKWIDFQMTYKSEKCRIYKDKNKYSVTKNYENHPVVCVSWHGATAYCDWLSDRTSKRYRLPTEAEWEFAAGNGSKHTKYSWGNDPPNGMAGNVADENLKINGYNDEIFNNYNDGYPYAAPVGRFTPNDFGLYDMNGNVWEWCSDWYDKGYYKTSPINNPQGPSSGKERVIRGGSFLSDSKGCRVASRLSGMHRSASVGFRVAYSN